LAPSYIPTYLPSLPFTPSLSPFSPCTTAIGARTDYGVYPPSGRSSFCTLPYANSVLVLSVHTAPPGYHLVATVTLWQTEACCDKGFFYTAAAGSTVTSGASCALAGGTALFAPQGGAGAVAVGATFTSSYGGILGMCFFSDFSITDSGILYTLHAEPCPAGSYCPADAAAPIPCPNGTSSSAVGATSSVACVATNSSTTGSPFFQSYSPSFPPTAEATITGSA
jgi:hypothetical protein